MDRNGDRYRKGMALLGLAEGYGACPMENVGAGTASIPRQMMWSESRCTDLWSHMQGKSRRARFQQKEGGQPSS